MQAAIDISLKSVQDGGGPFGAVVVQDGRIVGMGNNQVTLSNDPTAHAEIMAIREACQRLNTFQLTDCELYTSCEPCPMCFSAIYWARIKKIYYANTQQDAADIGFDDAVLYQELQDRKSVVLEQFMRKEALKVFKIWSEKKDKTVY